MVIGHPDDLPHCHTGWEWMCILPDDLHHLHMIFIIAEMYPAIIFTCGGFAPWWWWAASWGCGWTGGREARSNQLINTSSSYHQLIIIQSLYQHHYLIIILLWVDTRKGGKVKPLPPSFLCHHVNALMLSNVSIVQFWRVVCHQCNGMRKFHVVIRWIDLNNADGTLVCLEIQFPMRSGASSPPQPSPYFHQSQFPWKMSLLLIHLLLKVIFCCRRSFQQTNLSQKSHFWSTGSC